MNPDPKPFRFKEFEIHQNQCAMKVGTDGVLLGAYTKANTYNSILDIGCGTGLLALMLAQKSQANITALEIDPEAAKQAKYNVGLSPWKNRIKVIFTSIQKFSQNDNKYFDLIISNPPYFESTNKTSPRAIARNQSILSFDDLIKAVDLLLADRGIFGVIIPFESKEEFLRISQHYTLFLKETCTIKGKLNAKPKRCILYLTRKKIKATESELVIEKEKRHDYSQAYLELVEPYLL